MRETGQRHFRVDTKAPVAREALYKHVDERTPSAFATSASIAKEEQRKMCMMRSKSVANNGS